MSDNLMYYGIATYVSNGVLIVPFQAEFYPELVFAVQKEISQKLYEMSELVGLIIDISQVKILDLENLQSLENIGKSAILLGVKPYLVGMQPLLAMSLVEFGYENKDLNMALDIEHAMELIADGLKQEALLFDALEEDDNKEGIDE